MPSPARATENLIQMSGHQGNGSRPNWLVLGA